MATGGTIAVFLPNWVGDVVMATPAIRALVRHWPGRRIVYAGKPAALATLGPVAEPQDMIELPGGIWASARLLRRIGISRAVLLPNSFRSALIARLAGADSVAGYARDGRSWLLTDKLAPRRLPDGRYKPVPAIDYYIALAEMLGANSVSRDLALPLEPPHEAAAERILAECGLDRTRPIVMLNPGASFGTSKMWSAEKYAALADMLIDRAGARIIINAAPAEKRIAGWVARAMRNAPAISFADRENSLGLLKALLRRCDLLVTNDTGARHLAAAAGISVVTIFGSTDPEWSRIDYARERLVRVDVECGPCQLELCPLPAGPDYHKCLERVSPDMVLAAAEELLDAAKPGAPTASAGGAGGRR
jgi:heptosyltransferase-2